MRVLDCFSFFNEFDVLDLRLRELDSIVDEFIAVQGEETHSGMPKPLYLDPEDRRWEPWHGRLRSVTIPKIVTDDRWVRERAMRHVRTQALEPYEDDDVVILACADEIPDKDRVLELFPRLTTDLWASFLARTYFYCLNLQTPKLFPCIQLARVSTVRKYGAQRLQDLTRTPPIGPVEGAWHFSSLGTIEDLQTKIQAFAHGEFDNDLWRNTERLTDLRARLREPFHPGRRLRPVGLEGLPDEVRRHPDRYDHLLYAEVPA